MSLLDDVVATLRAADIPHALIGAAAMAAHGVSRATADVDLLVTSPQSLVAATWAALAATSDIDIRRGNDDDPLAGVARISRRGDLDVDVVVGKRGWQQGCVSRAAPSPADGIPVVRVEDLVLLKLYAGGPQDAWDIHQVLGLPDGARIVAAVGELVASLPGDAQTLWQRILNERTSAE